MTTTLERNAWPDARDLLDLPDALLDLADRHAELKARGSDPVPSVRPAEAHLLDGADDPVAAHDAEAAAAEKVRAANRATSRAKTTARQTLVRWFHGGNRDDLIEGPLRDAMADLLERAAPLADTLADLDTADRDALLADADDDQLDAWRKSRQLDRDWHRLLDCWTSSWKAATSINGNTEAPTHLRPDRPGGLHVWQQPRAIDDVEVRDGRKLDVLAVARWHDAATWTALSPRELTELANRTQTEQSWIPGERRPRKIMLPAEPKSKRLSGSYGYAAPAEPGARTDW